MQYRIDTTGWSHVSLMDAALGAGVGFGVPVLADHLMASMSAPPAWMSEYRPQLAAVSGLAAAIPLYFWRGFGPAVIAGMVSIAYGLNDLIQDYLAAAPVQGIQASRAMGVLSASPVQAQRRLPANQAQKRFAGVRAVPTFQGVTF